MLKKEEIQAIIDKISYKNWELKLGDKNGVLYLQIQFIAPDNFTGNLERQYCRKWQLSQFMCPSEIVRTAYKAVLTAEEHEVGEYFKYKEELIFCPHVDVEALVEVMQNNRLDVREEVYAK